jgi:hypothetical protein
MMFVAYRLNNSSLPNMTEFENAVRARLNREGDWSLISAGCNTAALTVEGHGEKYGIDCRCKFSIHGKLHNFEADLCPLVSGKQSRLPNDVRINIKFNENLTVTRITCQRCSDGKTMPIEQDREVKAVGLANELMTALRGVYLAWLEHGRRGPTLAS